MIEKVCQNLLNTYNTNFLEHSDKIISDAFLKASIEHRHGDKGRTTLMKLICNHYIDKPKPKFIGGPQNLTVHFSQDSKIVYIFGEHHSDVIDCKSVGDEEEAPFDEKKMKIEDFLEKWIRTTDVFLDIFFEFPMIDKGSKRYYPNFKPFPHNFRMEKLFEQFKKYVQPGTRNMEKNTLVRVHYFDARAKDIGGDVEGVNSATRFRLKIKNTSMTAYYFKELIKNAEFRSVLEALGNPSEEIFLDFWIEQIKTNTFVKHELDSCHLKEDILKFIREEIRTTVEFRVFLTKYIPFILAGGILDDSDFTQLFQVIYESTTIPNAFVADVYLLARIFKDFKIKGIVDQPIQPHNIIIYAGNAHSNTIRKFLNDVAGFQTLSSAGNLIIKKETAVTCVNMKTINKPLFFA
jgi:hypothetical protein